MRARSMACALSLAVAAHLHPPDAKAERDDAAPPPKTSVPSPNLLGARAGIEGTPTLALFYARLGPGIRLAGAETELVFRSAIFTGLHGYGLGIERREPLLRDRRYALLALLGTGAAFSEDGGGTYRGWTGALGVQATRSIAAWELGVRLAYLPTLITHVDFSAEARDTYRDRYPEARDQPGPPSATLWLAAQRLQALLCARALEKEWALDAALGLEWSALAGRQWSSLELGQLPLMLRVGGARRF